MKKTALIFVLAIFIPSLVLAWLAVRSLRDQQYLLERQQSLLYQSMADALAEKVQGLMAEKQREFGELVETLIADQDPQLVATSFHEKLRSKWPLAELGFAVNLNGNILAPQPWESAEAKMFLHDNDLFLANRQTAEVYWAQTSKSSSFSKADFFSNKLAQQKAMPRKVAPSTSLNDISANQNFNNSDQQMVPAQQPPIQQQEGQLLSKTTSAEAEFRQLVGEETSGAIARFLQNKLKLLLWYRSPRDRQLVFGSQLNLQKVIEDLKPLLTLDPNFTKEVCVVFLDDNGKPAAQTQPSFQANWKRPFVATEIGDVLPHWEVAIYLLNPEKLNQTARTLNLTLGLMIAILLFAIGVGGWLVVADVRRQMALARQKTDFVSNVSHELKTPLTSIRMFSELLSGGHVQDTEKRQNYLQIITAEAARLTRLINNVLDFARIERGEKKYDFQNFNFSELLTETVENYRPHLETHGFRLDYAAPKEFLEIRGDRDALAQVILNLLSNAEKYGDHAKEISVEIRPGEGSPRTIQVMVMDRGAGVPRGSEEKIFEQFYRAHNSLSSGIQGAGLGLTLARQIARAHGGDVTYTPREGGGSCFTLELKVEK